MYELSMNIVYEYLLSFSSNENYLKMFFFVPYLILLKEV